MTALWIVLGIFLLFTLLLLAPMVLRVRYDGTLWVELRYLFLRFRILPAAKKKKKEKKAEKKEKEADKGAKREPAKKEPSQKEQRSLMLTVLKESGRALKKALKALTVYDVDFCVTLNREDPFETATGYGRMNIYVYSLLGALRNLCRVKVKNIAIVPDFSQYGGRDRYRYEFKAKIRLGVVVKLALQLGARLLRYILQQQDQKTSRQGGAVQCQIIP